MFRSIIQSSLRFRPLVIVCALVLMVVGVNSLDDMSVDVFPEILPVTVHVQTESLGLSAGEVEQLITVPIEADLLTGTPWVQVMRSESVPGLSSIDLTFQPGTKEMDARQVVQERLTQAHALPNVSRPPQMLQPLSSTNRLMLVGLSSAKQSLIEMSVVAQWTIRPRLMGVPGVANVALWGLRERQLQVLVDPEQLRAKDVSLFDVVKTAGNALWYSPLSFLESSVAGTGGFIETPNQRIGVRHVLPISVAADLAKVPVEDSPLRLSQVATVVEDHQPLIGDALNGSAAGGLMLVIEKLPGANTLKVTREVEKALEQLKPGLGGIEFDTSVYRPANYLLASIDNVSKALLIGLILAAVAMLLLLYDWRAALVGLVSIPVALTAAVMVMYWSGATINVMVLAGIVIALGIVIDDAIVFADDFMRRLREQPGAPVLRTLLDAASEMRGMLLFPTVIVLLAAVPMLFVSGALGTFVKPLVVSYAVATIASLVAAVTLAPALSLWLFQKSPVARGASPMVGWFRGLAGRSSLSRLAIGVALLATVAAIVMAPRLHIPAAPAFREHDLLVRGEADPGTSRVEMNRIIDRMGRELESVPGVRNVGAHVGRAILSDQVVGTNSGEVWVSLDPKANYDATVAAVENVVNGYPGFEWDVTTYLRSRFRPTLTPVDKPIVVRLYGQEQDILMREAEKVKRSIAGIPGIVDPHLDLPANEPGIEIEVNLEKAAAFGVKPGDVRRAAATLLAGINVGNLFEDQKVFEVVVWGKPEIRSSVESIRGLLLDAPSGAHVRLGDVADVRVVSTPNVIRRENVARSLDIIAGVKGRSASAVAGDVSRRLRESPLPLEYRAELMGDYARQQAARTRVMVVTVAVLIGILFVLQAAFGSWAMALAFLVALPMALAGSVIAALLTGTSLSLASFAGFLAVLAIAVRHGMMLVGRYRDLRQNEDLEFGPELVVRGMRERATPILTAMITTAAAMLPFAVLGARPGLEVLGPMAIVIMGGLVTALVFTLWVVPALYSRFGAGAVHDETVLEDLDVAV